MCVFCWFGLSFCLLRRRFMARKNPRRNISRLQRVGQSGKVTGGWSMRIQRRGKKIEEFFSDQRYSGKRNALVAAQQRRDDIEYHSPRYSAEERADHPSSRNRSGMVGVRLHQQKDIRGEYEYSYWYWVAQWTDGRGRRRTRSFSIHSHGDEEAYNRACEARLKGLKQANR